MVSYLVLATNGTFTAHTQKGALSLKTMQQHLNGGYITYVPTKYTGVTNKTRTPLRKSVLIADEEGVMKQLPTNSWSFALAALGFTIPWMMGGLYGPLILAPLENSAGTSAGPLNAVFEQYFRAIKLLDGAEHVLFEGPQYEDLDQLEILLEHVIEHGTLPACVVRGLKRKHAPAADEAEEQAKKRPKHT